MTDLIDWSRLNDLPDDMRMRWPCTCVVCGFNHIWVVMSERCFYQPDETFRFDGERGGWNDLSLVSDEGYPVFWKRGREERVPEDPLYFNPNWTKNIAFAKHYLTFVEAEKAVVEATLLNPTAIGKLRAIQFRIR